MAQLQFCVFKKKKKSESERKRKVTRGNADRDAATTMLHSTDDVLRVMSHVLVPNSAVYTKTGTIHLGLIWFYGDLSL